MKIIVEINFSGKCEYCRFAKKYSHRYQVNPSFEKKYVCAAFYDKPIGTFSDTENTLKRLKECIEAEVKE